MARSLSAEEYRQITISRLAADNNKTLLLLRPFKNIALDETGEIIEHAQQVKENLCENEVGLGKHVFCKRLFCVE